MKLYTAEWVRYEITQNQASFIRVPFIKEDRRKLAKTLYYLGNAGEFKFELNEKLRIYNVYRIHKEKLPEALKKEGFFIKLLRFFGI